MTQLRNTAYIMHISLLSSLPNTSADTVAYLAEAQTHLAAVEDILGSLTIHLVSDTSSTSPDVDALVSQAAQHLTALPGNPLQLHLPHLLPTEDIDLPPQAIAGDKQPLSATRSKILPKRTKRDLPAPLSLESTFTQHE